MPIPTNTGRKTRKGGIREMFHTMEGAPTYGHDMRDAEPHSEIKEWTAEEKAAAQAKAKACFG